MGVLMIVRKLALALEAAHQHNVIHRDLKPANIMINAKGEPIVTDFGLARRLGARETLLTQSGMLIGTLAFMSPEQMEGITSRIGRATDIYSLGVIFYQLLTGIMPFRGSFVSVVVQVRHGKPVPPHLVRPELAEHPGVEAICLKMMAKRPEQRFASMAEVVSAIDNLSREPQVAPPPLPAAREPVAPPQRVSHAPIALPLITTVTPVVIQPISLTARWSRKQTLAAVTSCVGLLSLLAMFLVLSGMLNPLRGTQQELANSSPGDADLKPTTDPTIAAPSRNEKVEQPAQPADKVVGVPVAETTPAPPPKPLEVEPLPKIQPNVSFTRSAGSRIDDHKFGVAQIVIEFLRGEGPLYRPDLAVQVVASSGSIHYPAFALELESEKEEEALADFEAGDRGGLAVDGRAIRVRLAQSPSDDQARRHRVASDDRVRRAPLRPPPGGRRVVQAELPY